jgi:hypothetical protein
MDKFLELSFRNYCRNEKDSFLADYEKSYEPFLLELQKLLSKGKYEELEEILVDCYTEAMNIAGVAGMQLAINVLNGTDPQSIE